MTHRRPLAQVSLQKLPSQLRIDAHELSGCGAGNEAEHARQAADEIDRLRLIILTAKDELESNDEAGAFLTLKHAF